MYSSDGATVTRESLENVILASEGSVPPVVSECFSQVSKNHIDINYSIDHYYVPYYNSCQTQKRDIANRKITYYKCEKHLVEKTPNSKHSLQLFNVSLVIGFNHHQTFLRSFIP